MWKCYEVQSSVSVNFYWTTATLTDAHTVYICLVLRATAERTGRSSLQGTQSLRHLPSGHLRNRFPASALEPNSFASDSPGHHNSEPFELIRDATKVQIKESPKDHKWPKKGDWLWLETVLLRTEFYGRSSWAVPAEDRGSLDELIFYLHLIIWGQLLKIIR